jgi:hypothetical protein
VDGEEHLAMTSNAEVIPIRLVAEADNRPIERHRSAKIVVALEAGNRPIERYPSANSASNVAALEAGNHPIERHPSASRSERFGA